MLIVGDSKDKQKERAQTQVDSRPTVASQTDQNEPDTITPSELDVLRQLYEAVRRENAQLKEKASLQKPEGGKHFLKPLYIPVTFLS